MGLEYCLLILNRLKSSKLVSFTILAILFSGCMGDSHVEVQTFGKDQAIQLDPPSLENSITTSNFQVGAVSNSGFSLSMDYIGDENSNSSAILYYCNETLNPSCSPELVGDSVSLNKLSNQFDLNLSGLSAPDYNKGDYINIVVVVTDSDGVVGERFTQTIRMISILKIYRSVGFGNTAALATGAGNGLTISGGVASFASPLADNIGVGDAIQFDSANDGTIDSVIFISRRNSSTNYDVQTASGGEPGNLALADQDWSIFRAYTGLALAEEGTENTGLDDAIENFDTWSDGRDLVTNSEQWNIAYYADGSDNVNCQADNWITSEDSYLRFFVPSGADEVGVSQRHQGVWDNSKAIFSVSGGSFSADPFRVVDVAFVEIDGFQIETANESGREGIFANIISTPSKLVIRNNIIRANEYVSGSGIAGIAIDDGTLVAVNNIIYGFTGYGIETGSTTTGYLYNNTLFGNSVGIQSHSVGTITAYNNLSAGNEEDYTGSFDTSFGNISLDSSSENLDFRARQVEFHLKEKQDFRIKSSSYQAVGTAQDLSSDPIYAFNQDIVGNSRTRWDVGAFNAMSEKIIFRSIGPTNTSALAVGTGNDFTITENAFGHTEAVFTSFINGNIGVGDAIQYDSTGGSTINSIAFISERIDDYTFIVKGADGENAQVTVTQSDSWSIFRSYLSFADANNLVENTSIDPVVVDFDIAGSGPNLLARNEQWNFAVYTDAADTLPTGEFGEAWATDETRYLKIFTPYLDNHVRNRQRHIGKFEQRKLNIDATGSGRGINICSDYMRIEGLTTRTENTTYSIGYCSSFSRLISGNYTILSHNIVSGKNQPAYSRNGIGCNATNNQTVYIFNNIVSDFDPTNGLTVGINANCSGNFLVYNNTSINNGRGYSGLYGLFKNNLAYANSTGFNNAGASGSGYNMSDDGSAAGAGGNDISNTIPLIKDYDYKDFRLDPNDTSAKSSGENLKFDEDLRIYTDILNHPKGNFFDIGAHEAGNEIFRSIGPGSTSALASGGGNSLTISGGTATFASGVSSAIGVGDAIQYDSDGNGSVDRIAFIHSRFDSQNFTVREADGGIPNDLASPEEDWAIFRSYTSLSDAENGSENSGLDLAVREFDDFNGDGGRDIVKNGETWNFALYGDAIDTSAVTIEDWITGPTREIRIFTPQIMSESGNRQRHEGVWNDYFYSLQPAQDESSLVINVPFVTVEGLQIQTSTSASGYRSGIVVGYYTGDGVFVTGNIIRDGNTGISNRSGIIVNHTQNGMALVSNNIVYGFSGTGGVGINIDNGTEVQAVYNNTTASNDIGIRCSYHGCILRNNLSALNPSGDLPSNAVPSLQFSNLSSDNTAASTGPNSIPNVVPSFIDINLHDYRLSSDDTVAKELGANLYEDEFFPIFYDGTGHIRGHDSDIGAFEAANNIFRSIGPGNTSSLANGSGNNLTISGSVATFTSGIPDNIGVGDGIQYDRDNNGTIDDIMFIHARISDTQFVVADNEGSPVEDMANADEDWDIYRAYSSTSGATGGSENPAFNANIIDFDDSEYRNLLFKNVQLNLAVYSDGVGSNLDLRYFRTTPTNFIKVFAPDLNTEVGMSQRHKGVWDNSKARLVEDVYGAVIYITGGFDYSSNHLEVDGLQIENTRTTGSGGDASGVEIDDVHYPGFLKVTNSILRKSGGVVDSNEAGISAYGDNYKFIAVNNIIYDFSNGIRSRVASGDGANLVFYNNTIVNSVANGFAISAYGANDSLNLKNNLIQNSGTADFGIESTAEIMDIVTNITSDNTGPGGSDIIDTEIDFVFPSTDDYRLNSSDTDAINSGTDLSSDTAYLFSTDIIAANRAQWDIGAFAYEDFSALTSFSAKGSGTPEDPYELFSRAQIKNIGEDTTNGCNASTSAGCGLHFEIMNDINLVNEAFTPIGSTGNPFTGDFDGNQFTLSNLSITLPTTDDVGLFGHICSGYIYNLRLSRIDVSGQSGVGGLIGKVSCAGNTVSQVKIFSGEVSGTNYVGGVIGITTEITASDILTRANVTSSLSSAGGVLGESATAINASFSNTYSYGNVTATAGDYIGGFVGRFGGTGSIVDSYAVGDVTNNGASESCTGGFAGTTETTGLISRSWAGGDTKAAYQSVGGFVGCVDGASSISHSFAMGRTQSPEINIGGFAGLNNGVLTNNYATGDIVLTSSNYYGGGFVGNNSGSGSISKSYATGNINGQSNSNYIGGFVGLNAGAISLSHAKGNVLGGSQVGGFVGVNNSGAIANSYSLGDVTGTSLAGGFVGNSYGSSLITDSYTRYSHVRGDTAGGFAGEVNVATLSNNYALSIVEGTTSAYSFIHTLTSGTLSDNYWNNELSPLDGTSSATSSAGEYTGMASGMFKDSANLDSSQSGVWDYATVWTQLDERDYPVHKNTPEGNCIDSPTASSHTDIGTGTFDDPFVICNEEQFESFESNSSDHDKVFVLGSNIEFHGQNPSKIDNFSGVFDGKGYALKNYQNYSGGGDQGVFGVLTGIVKNVELQNYFLDGSIGGASLVVLPNNGQILNNMVDGSVNTASCCTGGFSAGFKNLKTDNYSIYYGNEFVGDISASGSAGGIIGDPGSGLHTLKNKVYAEIVTSGGTTGGISGANSYLSKKNKTFGSVTASNRAGGIFALTGSNGLIDQSFSKMDITTTSGGDNGGLGGSSAVIRNSYSKDAVIDSGGSVASGLSDSGEVYHSYAFNTLQNFSDAAGIGFGLASGMTENFWSTEIASVLNGRGGSSGSVANQFEGKTNADMLLDATYVNWDSTNIWLLSNTIRTPLLKWDVHPYCHANATAVNYNDLGAGTFQNPYRICFKEQLLDLSVSGCDGDSSAGCTSQYVLMNDIDLKNETYTPIGDSTNSFAGTFDGQGYTISNLAINAPASDDQGLFGVNNGFIHSLNLKEVSIEGRSNVGALAGSSTGVIKNIKVYGNIIGNGATVGGVVGYLDGITINLYAAVNVSMDVVSESVGGLVGFVDVSGEVLKSGVSGTVTNGDGTGTPFGTGGALGRSDGYVFDSWANVEVIGTYGAGGFVGYIANNGVVRYSYALGASVLGYRGVGGFVGHMENNATVEYSYSRVASLEGTNGAPTVVGGFVGGSNGSSILTNNYSTASSIVGTANLGAFSGFDGGTYSNNYWDNTLYADTNSAGEYEGLTTGDMDDSANFNTWNDTTVWRFPAGKYPELITIK